MNYLNLKVQIRELIKNNFDRDVLTEVLLDLRKDLSGQSQFVLIELYKDLGLHHDAYKKLGSRKWQVVSSGILELTTMEVDESYGLIIKFINHRQSTIRKQAEIAVVNLKEEGIKYYLDNTKFKIAEWQQLKLLDVLRHKPNYSPPQFGLWLTSTNTHVVLFSLRLIKYYSQNDAEQSIITLLKHKNRDIQAEAIECIKDFHFSNALMTLKLVYSKASHDIKIAILDAIGELGTKAEASFLENLQLTERNFNIKSKVIGTLNKIDPERVLPTKNISTADFYDVEFDDAMQEEEHSIIDNHEGIILHDDIIDVSTEIDNETIATETKKEMSDIFKEDTTYNETEEVMNEEFVNEEKTEFDAELQQNDVKKINSIEDIDLSFLPHIKDEEALEEKPEETEAVDDNDQDQESEEELTFNFLPFVIEEDVFEEVTTSYNDEDFRPLFELDDELLGEVPEETSINPIDNTSTKMAHVFDWSTLDSENEEQNKVVIDTADLAEPLISFENDNLCFAANFMPQEELDAMVMLENISELGDCRELILLYQIIEKNSSEVVIERANELIQKFSYQSPRPNELFSEDNNLAESVFTDIYNLADYETKLMLIGEIKKVGDEKEIDLLESVIQSESKKLVKKATEALEYIKSQLLILDDKTKSTSDEDFILNVGFELESNNSIKYKGTVSNENGSTLFDQLCSMSNSLYRKKDG
ncbi:HEAT repeat domain-containing protein [Maribacter sp. 1_MG-2023]|uniref:HEAT repeat domain-containing protein n=1 Tax=Maribacter sp. 1_MG-2023 TaxID=3062677 RepID=UPI0026E2C224|nr:HEAT repeat domain-containing protein [Maribacter sp. 1_MG-2023]MDO6473326.1 HEAT repeat domain-containing protein [Maribacter sp. 1_MG-2023]